MGLRGLSTGAVTIRDLVRHALRHRLDHIVVGEVRGDEAADLLQALNTRTRRLAYNRACQQRRIGSVAARQLRQVRRSVWVLSQRSERGRMLRIA